MPSFVPNPDFRNELQREPSYRSAIARAAAPAVDFAKSFAPVRSGNYRDSIDIVEDRDKVYLSAHDFKAVWIEFGTGEPGPTPAFAPLRRGVRAAGLKLTE